MSKISELSDGGAIQSGDTLIAVRSGGNVKVTYGGTTTANIDGGTIDGTVIGGSSAAAGSFTTISASGEIAANGGVAFGDNNKATFGASDDLQIYHDGSNSIIKDGGTGNLNILAGQLRIKNPTDAESLIEADVNGAVRLYYDNAEKLATTATGIDVTGTVTAESLGIGTSSPESPIDINRTSTDGNIATFRKDGATVGSIGTKNNDLTVGTGDTGLRFTDSTNQIWAVDTTDGSSRDAAVDLGNSTVRFRDLYLSGGVYLGGTGAANHLDDYETGTFTPTVGGTWLTNPTSLAGRYTKIGDLVYISITFANGVKASATAGWLAGLPFSIVYNGTGSCVDSAVENQGLCLFSNTGRIWLTDNSFTASSVTVTGCYKA